MTIRQTINEIREKENLVNRSDYNIVYDLYVNNEVHHYSRLTKLVDDFTINRKFNSSDLFQIEMTMLIKKEGNRFRWKKLRVISDWSSLKETYKEIY